MPDAFENELPQLVVFTRYPPNRRVGVGIILYNLLNSYPPNRLVIITNGKVFDDLYAHPDHGVMLPAAYVKIYTWTSQIRGVRRLLRSLSSLKIVSMIRAGL